MCACKTDLLCTDEVLHMCLAPIEKRQEYIGTCCMNTALGNQKYHAQINGLRVYWNTATTSKVLH